MHCDSYVVDIVQSCSLPVFRFAYAGTCCELMLATLILTFLVPIGLTALRAYAISGRSLPLAISVFLLGLVSPAVDIVCVTATRLARRSFLTWSPVRVLKALYGFRASPAFGMYYECPLGSARRAVCPLQMSGQCTTLTFSGSRHSIRKSYFARES